VFNPSVNESGFDHELMQQGVGNAKSDYAKLKYDINLEGPEGSENSAVVAGDLTIDIDAVVDQPLVTVELSLVPGTGVGPTVPITQVNGGSGVRGGFDVQDGKIVAIGEGVRLWLTEGDAIPEVADGAVVQYYTGANAGGSGSYSDVFLLHSQSAYFYRQSDWAPDRKEAKDLDSVHGNEQGENNGLKDYIFLQAAPSMSYSHQFSTNNNACVNVNTFNGVEVYYSGPNGSGSLLNQVSNQLEGVIYGDGATLPLLADPEDTKIITIPGGAPAEYELDVEAIVQDLDGSEWLGNE